ncbi:ATP-dependent DNA ligase [Pedobacter gandavensis]|uniref:DNA ligase (ATP) n=1 Tax=Pedobacter gandavensis TaxID=2679963 RepID=A0ABR6EU00_9SPHI|nr:ATP-dependent DNA ligase [Pedobacter gandavensis]MBB2148745.1 ATP-dependent DNA ligase [Pedobacter gandavensis]
MKRFTELIAQLESSNKTNDKLAALVAYFNEAEDQDKPYVIAMFTGKRPKRPVGTALLKEWAIEKSGIAAWLFTESYHHVGDLSETIALILPPPKQVSDLQLNEWIKALSALNGQDDASKKHFITNSWDSLEIPERFVFNKLISGNFRIGISGKMLVNALARQSNIPANQIMHSIMGNWNPEEITYKELLAGAHVNTDNSWPYPFCLAYALDQEPASLGAIQDWQAEWKWDGIRGQIVKRGGELFIWSRGEELVTDQFPELHFLREILPDGTVLDGEILAIKAGKILPFSLLQQRLNRKTIAKSQLENVPVGFYCYDLLEYHGKDQREATLNNRRKNLVQLIAGIPEQEMLLLSPVITAKTWAELGALRADSRAMNSEGLMLKKLDSLYHSGRKRGDWWKWKINPYTVDAVMIYAQKGSGRRAGFFTDYTFAVRDGDQLITIAKAYSGLTDAEIKEVDAFVKKNAIEKFGPVRTVKPILVFEIAFEGIAESKRHKAGLALRFPRISRWRKDKKAEEINTLTDLRQLLNSTL